MWTPENRPRYGRDKLRYPSDLTDEEWPRIEPLIPPAKHGGRDREVDEREIVNGLMYVLSTSCQWRYIPKDLPARSTLHGYLQRWQHDGTLARIRHVLHMACREQIGREASPAACVIDGQSVKSAEKGGPALIRTAMTRARGSRAKSDISLSIRQDCRCMRSFIRRTFRTVTGACMSCRPCSAFIHSCKTCSPTADIRGRSSAAPWRKPCQGFP